MSAVLVTGGAKRIGRSICEALAADGWRVYVHFNSSAAEAEATVQSIRQAGGEAEAVAADLSDPESVETLIGKCRDLTCLINNASVFKHDQIGSLTIDGWRRHSDINVLAPALLARDFSNALPKDGQGAIINILDNKVIALNPDHFSYTVSKVGLHGMTEILALALAPRIRVCAIAPGVTLPSDVQTVEGFGKAQKLNPLGRGCTPGQIVGAVRFILSTPAMTGQVITIDGGQHLAPQGRDVYFLTEDLE